MYFLQTAYKSVPLSYCNDTNVLLPASGRVWYEADVGLSNTMSRSNHSELGRPIRMMAFYISPVIIMKLSAQSESENNLNAN
jgi:hypothetical protein